MIDCQQSEENDDRDISGEHCVLWQLSSATSLSSVTGEHEERGCAIQRLLSEPPLFRSGLKDNGRVHKMSHEFAEVACMVALSQSTSHSNWLQRRR